MVNRSANYQYNHSSVQKATIDLVPESASRVLDVGGGNGAFTLAVAKACGANFSATVDISQEAISGVKQGVDVAEVIDIEKSGEIESFVEVWGPFDLILCLDVLEHLVDPWRVVSRLHSLLSEDGRILFSIPNVQNYRIALRALMGTWHYRESGLFDRTHLRFFSRRSAQALVTGSGLVQIAYGRTYGPNPRDRFAAYASLGLLAPWLTMQHVIVAQKQSLKIRDPGMFGDLVPFS